MHRAFHFFASLSLALTLAPAARAAGEQPKPNILFLLSDDHSYPFVGAYGDTNVRTPALDSLAAEGMKFHRFYTTAPQCVPSRASLMTGRSPVAARIVRFSSPLMREETIYPELLRREAGYYTGICGRAYHLDGSGGAKGKGKAGKGGVMSDLLEKHDLATFQDRVDFLEPCADGLVAEKLGNFLDGKPAEKPFYLWMNFSDPHHPWNTGGEKRPDPAKLKLPAVWPDQPGMREQLADYCAEVNHLDATVAGVLAVLKERKILDQTLIVFAGDNGMAFPRGKGSLHELGCHVPLLVRWPGHVKPGTESRDLLSGEDLAPTLLAAAGVAVPKRITGTNFLPLLEGKPKEYAARSFVFTERGPHGSAPVTVNMASSGYDLSRGVCNARYRMIYNCTPWIPYGPVDSSAGAGWQGMTQASTTHTLAENFTQAYFITPRPVYELYDLERDPAEFRNLADKPEYASVQRELLVAMAEKMITDFDFLPLPAIPAGKNDPAPSTNTTDARAESFLRMDKNGDGKLSKDEFFQGKPNSTAEDRFLRRDQDKSGDLSREEYLPGALPDHPAK